MTRKGLSLVEILLATLIIVTVAGAVFSLYPQLFQGVDVSSQKMVAFEEARQEIETLRNLNSADFSTLLYNVSYDPANNETPNPRPFNTIMANSSGVYYVEKMHRKDGSLVDNLVSVEVLVCFRVGRRMVGEDANFNGGLDAGEDQNGDNKITSPVSLRTLIMRP